MYYLDLCVAIGAGDRPAGRLSVHGAGVRCVTSSHLRRCVNQLLQIDAGRQPAIPRNRSLLVR